MFMSAQDITSESGVCLGFFEFEEIDLADFLEELPG